MLFRSEVGFNVDKVTIDSASETDTSAFHKLFGLNRPLKEKLDTNIHYFYQPMGTFVCNANISRMILMMLH